MSSSIQELHIVPISEETLDGFYHCLDAVARERRFLAFVQAPPFESAREFVLSNIANGIPQFVAIADGQVVGWCDILPKQREGFTHCGSLGMGILKHYRGLGIGQQLMAATLQRAKEIGLERIELSVFASNFPAIRLYEKMGFIVEGIRRKARKIDGAYDDNIEMALFI